jgi:hypothetical protein
MRIFWCVVDLDKDADVLQTCQFGLAEGGVEALPVNQLCVKQIFIVLVLFQVLRRQ